MIVTLQGVTATEDKTRLTVLSDHLFMILNDNGTCADRLVPFLFCLCAILLTSLTRTGLLS